MPVHYLSVPIDEGTYERPPWVEKEQLLLFSPDDPAKNAVVAELVSARVPELDLVEVKKMPYLEYRDLLRRARWTFSFGEGLDYYFVETIFSGGIAFAVYNDRFFTPEYRQLETVYASFDELCRRVAADVERLDRPAENADYRSRALELVARNHNIDLFESNLTRFLRHEYTWPYSVA